MSQRIDIAFFIAKKYEFDKYKKGDTTLSVDTIDGRNVLFSQNRIPALVVVQAYDCFLYAPKNKEEKEYFFKKAIDVIDNMVGIEEEVQIAIFAHFEDKFNFQEKEWNDCVRFMNNEASNFNCIFNLISSTSPRGQNIGLANGDKIVIPEGEAFFNWYNKDNEEV